MTDVSDKNFTESFSKPESNGESYNIVNCGFFSILGTSIYTNFAESGTSHQLTVKNCIFRYCVNDNDGPGAISTTAETFSLTSTTIDRCGGFPDQTIYYKAYSNPTSFKQSLTFTDNSVSNSIPYLESACMTFNTQTATVKSSNYTKNKLSSGPVIKLITSISSTLDKIYMEGCFCSHIMSFGGENKISSQIAVSSAQLWRTRVFNAIFYMDSLGTNNAYFSEVWDYCCTGSDGASPSSIFDYDGNFSTARVTLLSCRFRGRLSTKPNGEIGLTFFGIRNDTLCHVGDGDGGSGEAEPTKSTGSTQQLVGVATTATIIVIGAVFVFVAFLIRSKVQDAADNKDQDYGTMLSSGAYNSD